ncbi:hypothetical protein BC941DRAFT_424583 [Chlamydoabsidia padenii]|nr:hypothetical protein BC941DRAFT_424583 [Chlamydoabsidia padenii]
MQQQYPSPAYHYHHPSYGGVEPQYHHGQYQQLYNQLTERQQQGPVQRPYAEFQQQYMRPPRQDIGGFRIPTSSSSPSLSADEEKRLLAERYAMEETQARKASIQTMHHDSSVSSKKSVILPEGEDHGYTPSKKK